MTKHTQKRNSKSGEEDLLQRFLDGLADSNAQFHVEYVKEPEIIDVVTIQVVNFDEIGLGQKNIRTKQWDKPKGRKQD